MECFHFRVTSKQVLFVFSLLLSFFPFDTSNLLEGKILTVGKYWFCILVKSQFLQDKLWEKCSFCIFTTSSRKRFSCFFADVYFNLTFAGGHVPNPWSMQSLWIDLIYYLFPGSPFESFKMCFGSYFSNPLTELSPRLHTGYLVAILTIQ